MLRKTLVRRLFVEGVQLDGQLCWPVILVTFKKALATGSQERIHRQRLRVRLAAEESFGDVRFELDAVPRVLKDQADKLLELDLPWRELGAERKLRLVVGHASRFDAEATLPS